MTKGNIIIWAIVTLLFNALVAHIINENLWEDALKEVAEECYKSESTYATIVRGERARAEYYTTDTLIVAIVYTESGRSYTKTDINKSKIVGEFLGKKFRQGLEGWKDGFSAESKFKETEQ